LKYCTLKIGKNIVLYKWSDHVLTMKEPFFFFFSVGGTLLEFVTDNGRVFVFDYWEKNSSSKNNLQRS